VIQLNSLLLLKQVQPTADVCPEFDFSKITCEASSVVRFGNVSIKWSIRYFMQRVKILIMIFLVSNILYFTRVVNIEVLQLLQYVLQYFYIIASNSAILLSFSIDFDIEMLFGCILAVLFSNTFSQPALCRQCSSSNGTRNNYDEDDVLALSYLL